MNKVKLETISQILHLKVIRRLTTLYPLQTSDFKILYNSQNLLIKSNYSIPYQQEMHKSNKHIWKHLLLMSLQMPQIQTNSDLLKMKTKQWQKQKKHSPLDRILI